MAVHFSFPLLMTLALTGIFGFSETLMAQGSSVSPTQSSAVGDEDDEGLNPRKNSGPAAHPEDASDLGPVTLKNLATKQIYWMCRNRSVIRTLKIEPYENGCRTAYTKDGVERNASVAQMPSSCVGIFANIRRNLESAGWKCKDISQSRVSDNL